MVVTWGATADTAIRQLFELSCGSNGKLYSAGVKLGLIDPATVRRDSFHYHVTRQNWRLQIGSHYKREQLSREVAPDLSKCRLGSSARVQFSVRLVPISFYIRQLKASVDEPVPDSKQTLGFGILGLVQELCSGLLRAEVLLGDVTTRSDIYGLSEESLVEFVARSISLPGLKCSAIHFPAITFARSPGRAKATGLVSAWLGVPQPNSLEATLEERFKLFSECVINKAKWGAVGHKIRPDVSIFRMDFPPQHGSVLLDLTKPCGKGWAMHTLTRQLRERLDRYNTAVGTDGSELSPALRLWIARLCYFPADRDDEVRQRAALEATIRSVCYRKRISSTEIVNLQDVGISHLNANAYPTTK